MFPLDPYAERLVAAAADLQRQPLQRAARLLAETGVREDSSARRSSLFARARRMLPAATPGAQAAGRHCPPLVEAE